MSACKSCDAPIFFAMGPRHADGTRRSIPLNAGASEEGNIRVIGEFAEVLAGMFLADAQAKGEALHVSHFATCPNAGWHRNPGRSD